MSDGSLSRLVLPASSECRMPVAETIEYVDCGYIIENSDFSVLMIPVGMETFLIHGSGLFFINRK